MAISIAGIGAGWLFGYKLGFAPLFTGMFLFGHKIGGRAEEPPRD